MGMKYILFLFFISAQAFSIEYVYRVDSRLPNDIFRTGFNSWGQNLNLQEHIRGHSCNSNGDSAYISTTRSLLETNAIARQYLTGSITSRHRYFRYQIRPDLNYYSLRPSVDYLSRNGVVFNEIENVMMADQDEVVAMLNINRSNIVSAVEIFYDRNTGAVTESTPFLNPNYDDLNTGFRNVIIPDLLIPTNPAGRIFQVFGYLIPACLSSSGARGNRRTADEAKNYNATTMINLLLNVY